MANAPTTTQCRRDLNTLSAPIAREDSRNQYTMTCFRSHTIPQGLTINAYPCVPKESCREPTAHLQKEWAKLIRQAANGFLAALNTYHRRCAEHLRLQATNLESSIAAWLGETKSRSIRKVSKTVYAKCDCHLQEQQKNKATPSTKFLN